MKRDNPLGLKEGSSDPSWTPQNSSPHCPGPNVILLSESDFTPLIGRLSVTLTSPSSFVTNVIRPSLPSQDESPSTSIHLTRLSITPISYRLWGPNSLPRLPLSPFPTARPMTVLGRHSLPRHVTLSLLSFLSPPQVPSTNQEKPMSAKINRSSIVCPTTYGLSPWFRPDSTSKLSTVNSIGSSTTVFPLRMSLIPFTPHPDPVLGHLIVVSSLSDVLCSRFLWLFLHGLSPPFSVFSAPGTFGYCLVKGSQTFMDRPCVTLGINSSRPTMPFGPIIFLSSRSVRKREGSGRGRGRVLKHTSTVPSDGRRCDLDVGR